MHSELSLVLTDNREDASVVGIILSKLRPELVPVSGETNTDFVNTDLKRALELIHVVLFVKWLCPRHSSLDFICRLLYR